MKRTSIAGLFAAGGFSAALLSIVTWRFYGAMLSVPVTVSLTLWIMAVLCLVLAWRVKDKLGEGMIGHDRSQLNPVTVAQFLVIAKASAWTGSIVGGAYLGMATYILPRIGYLSAAAQDLPGVVASCLGGIAMAAAGVYLERACQAPPPPDGEAAG